MKKFKQIFFKTIPKYAVVPLLLTLVANLIAYYGSLIIVDLFDIPRHNVHFPIDDLIPFMPQWITVYFGCYISWVVFYIIICRESKEVCYNFVTAEIIAKLICLIVFVVYPTEMMHRPDALSATFFDKAANFLYAIDKPYNLFPSIHCFASWICFRGISWCEKVPVGVKITAFVIAILVFLSTVFTKQHYVIDIIGGIIVTEIGIFISKKLKLGDCIKRKVYHER
ncbi:MAG: phosphatase PAP2 family protein [Acutalibacteraceae bacterium]